MVRRRADFLVRGTNKWPFILVFMGLWKRLEYSTIIYYAALMGIDLTLYEAAAIDGANLWQRIWRITVPMLMPIVVVLTILGLGRIFFADFGLHYQLCPCKVVCCCRRWMSSITSLTVP